MLQAGCTLHLPHSIDRDMRHAGNGYNFHHNLDIPTSYSVLYWYIPKEVEREINEFQHKKKEISGYAHN